MDNIIVQQAVVAANKKKKSISVLSHDTDVFVLFSTIILQKRVNFLFLWNLLKMTVKNRYLGDSARKQ